MEIRSMCEKVQTELVRTKNIGVIYESLLCSLTKRSIELNFDSNMKHLNKVFCDNILKQLNNLLQLTKRYGESLVDDGFETLANIFCENNFCMFWKDKFAVNRLSLDRYNLHPDLKSSCIIVHVDEKTEIFYIYDIDDEKSAKLSTHFDELQEVLLNDVIEIKDEFPGIGEVFGHLLNGRLHRAVRENCILDKDSQTYDAYLMDVGKEVTLAANEQIYILPTKLQEEPALAIPCKLHSLKTYGMVEKSKFITCCLHQKFQFSIHVSDPETPILYLKLEYSSNPFLSYLNSVENGWFGIIEENTPPNNTDNLKEFFESTITMDEANMRCINSNLKYDDLSLEDRQMLYEESLNTTNALKATIGYIPKDDQLICKFTENGTCFKGSRCQLQHIQQNPFGWTRDQASVIIDNQVKVIYPAVGSTIKIIPTHILTVAHFFAQIEQDSHMRPTLRELAIKMNSEDELNKYRKYINSFPVKFELVIAQYTDGLFYRAKVMSSCADEDFIQVFYVDYGNIELVSLRQLRLWEPKYGILPFQAINFHLVGIRGIEVTQEKAEAYLKANILNKTLKATVINNVNNDIRVKMFLKNNFELNSELIRLGFAKEFYDMQILSMEGAGIPG